MTTVLSDKAMTNKKNNNKEYLKKFYEKHPEKRMPQHCDVCGGSYMYILKSRHINCQKHQKALLNQQ